MVSEVYRGMLLVFPRDALAARMCLDGRWERSEGKVPTVPNCPVRPTLTAWPSFATRKHGWASC